MTDEAPALKKREINDQLRQFCRLVLKASEMDYSIEGEDVFMKWDDVCRLVAEVANQHHEFHTLQNKLRHLFPVIGLVEGSQASCVEYHERFPSSKELQAFSQKVHEERAEAGRDKLFEMLGVEPMPLPGIDPTKAN